MNTHTRSLMAIVMMTTLAVSPFAEAKRIGGGKSSGMSRSTSSSSYSTPTRPVQPVQPVSPAPTAQRSSGVGMGTVAGAAVAAGAAGYMLGHANDANAQTQTATTENPMADTAVQPQEEKSGFSWFWLLILAAIGFFIYRAFAKKSKPVGYAMPAGSAQPTPQYGGQGNGGTNIFGQSVGSAAGAIGGAATGGFSPNSPFTSSDTLPDGSTKAAFLRQARATFLHMQTMNSGSQVEELRRYFTPQMFDQVRHDIMTNKDTAEFPQLNAQVVESTTEQAQHVVSVRFSGTVSESLDAPAVPFSEVWHFVKDLSGGDWQVAGIEQD